MLSLPSFDSLEVLRDARELISDPRCWTKEWFALNACGDRVTSNASDAICFCALGAVRRSMRIELTEDYRRYIKVVELLENAVGRSVSDFNDAAETTHADVLAAFDEAIAKAQGSVAAGPHTSSQGGE